MHKKNRTAVICLGLVSLTLSASSHAEMPGFYASVQLGYGNTHITTSNLVSIYSGTTPVPLPDLNHLSLAYRLAFGYQLDDHYAIEFGYRRFNNTRSVANGPDYSADASSQVRAFDLLTKGIIPVPAVKGLNLYGKLGLAYVKPNSQAYAFATGPYTAQTARYANTLEPTFGLGVSYTLKPNVPIDLSWNRIQKLGGSSHVPSSDFYALGVAYYFG